MSNRPKFYVAHGVEVCMVDRDGDDLVLAVCGASSSNRSHLYSRPHGKSAREIAQRIVDLLNVADLQGPTEKTTPPTRDARHE